MARGALQAMAMLVLAGCVALPSPQQRPVCDAAADQVPWQWVAPSVWVWLPETANADIHPGNAGHVAPTTAIVDRGEALLIDPGPSHRHGLRLKRSLQCRWGARVIGIVNTHAHAEAVLANSAFADEQARGGLRIGASAATAEAMRRRCPDCLAHLSMRIGKSAMAGTRITLPDQVLAPGMLLRVGQRELRVWAVEQGHTEGDLVLWDAQHRVLWAGGLVYAKRVPELAQGHVDRWLAALDRLAALPARHVIGAAWSTPPPRSDADAMPPALADTRRYLADLRAGVLQAMEAGRLPQEPDVVPLPAYAHWAGYPQRHGFNVLRAWRELETVWMEGAADASRAPAEPSVDQPGR